MCTEFDIYVFIWMVHCVCCSTNVKPVGPIKILLKNLLIISFTVSKDLYSKTYYINPCSKLPIIFVFSVHTFNFRSNCEKLEMHDKIINLRQNLKFRCLIFCLFTHTDNFERKNINKYTYTIQR
jgi:hypothetical protein